MRYGFAGRWKMSGGSQKNGRMRSSCNQCIKNCRAGEIKERVELVYWLIK